MAVLQNKAGQYIAPGDEAGKAALASAEFPSKTLPGSDAPDLRVWLFDPAGAQAYPIATFTWMLFYKDQDDAKAKVLRELVEYGLTKGQAMAPKMGYIPLPENVIGPGQKSGRADPVTRRFPDNRQPRDVKRLPVSDFLRLSQPCGTSGDSWLHNLLNI
jgi:hypothetical protein